MSITINDRRQPAAAGLTHAREAEMANADEIWVRPTSTYFDLGEHRTSGGKPYRVTRAHGGELEGLGIAEIVNEEPQAAAEEPVLTSDRGGQPVASSVADLPTSEASPAKRHGRPLGGAKK